MKRAVSSLLVQWSSLAFMLCLMVVLGYSTTAPGLSEQSQSVRFGTTEVWRIELELEAREYEAMQPATPAFAPPGGAAPGARERTPGSRASERNLFGTEFPWVRANCTITSKVYERVGIRYSGDITYLVSARGLKRPLRIAFDQFGPQTLEGHSAVELLAMPLDPSQERQALASQAFRAAGVPAPATAFAEVTLTVPGRHTKELVGLYTVVEAIDAGFLQKHFGTAGGLLMKPAGLRGIDYLGEAWSAYVGRYQPQRPATQEEARRVIQFARLIQQASDEEFRTQLGTFIDVDEFLRFLAAHAYTCNLESFFALGHNYHLYLHPTTGKFHFIPGGLEFSLANFLLMGSAEQLMDLSITKPYPGENRLPDRLLAQPEVRRRYLEVFSQLSKSAFAREELGKQHQAIRRAIELPRQRERTALAARRETPPGFGGPGGIGPQPPDIEVFLERRAASVARQLTGSSKGFVPQQPSFGPPAGGGFGPPAGGGTTRPIDEQLFRTSVHAPPEFEVALFAAPPRVNYPVAVAAEPSGAVYVAVDEQGSLGRTPGGGKVLRCVDQNDDGKLDGVTVFARIDHPRGLCYRAGSLWVMHPPTLSVFHDDNGDGVADRQDVLVTGLTTDQITNRGGDHTTNCVRLGIDGWLYIGVGDYGIKQARGKDGRTISLRGGGVVRVRPDGTELEIYCTGLRNPFDLAIDPFMNLFTRDNTNDGGGWDTRVSQLWQSALYGYTQLYANFTDEIMPTLGTFGGGGGTGGLFIQDDRWPVQYRSTLLTADWGRSEVYRHDLRPHGPTFDLQQQVFIKLPRATGMDIDGQGRLYLASWHGGEASVFVGPNVGFIVRVTPKGLRPEPFPDLGRAELPQLVQLLASPRAVTRLHAQGEILKRGRHPETTRSLIHLASDPHGTLEARAAAIFTLKQLDGKDSHAALLELAARKEVGEFALRALTDRASELAGLEAAPFLTALNDEAARTQAQAVVSLGRLGDVRAARHLLPLTARRSGSTMPAQRPVQNQPDPDRVIPHLAVRALVALNAHEACLEGLDGPHRDGALWALRYLHDSQAVDGLIKKLASARDPELRRGILAVLIRLYHREADYDGSWWGIRPDNTGPYYDPVEWSMSRRIGSVLKAALLDSDPDTLKFLRHELRRCQVSLPGVATEAAANPTEKEAPLVLPKADPNNPDQIGNLGYEVVLRRALASKGDANRGEALFRAQSCTACHTTADGQTPRGPHLVDIGKRYKPEELIESIVRPSAKLAQGYESHLFATRDGLVVSGFVVRESAQSVLIRESNGLPRELRKEEIEQRSQQQASAMPEGLVANLTPAQLADLLAYLQSLK